jgi:hypothetical protein
MHGSLLLFEASQGEYVTRCAAACREEGEGAGGRLRDSGWMQFAGSDPEGGGLKSRPRYFFYF